MPKPRVIWLNGAFDAGKTTVTRKLASLLPDAMTLDPEDSREGGRSPPGLDGLTAGGRISPLTR